MRQNTEFYNEIRSKANVVGVATGLKNGTGEECHVVLVERKVPESALRMSDILPKWHYGVTVDVLEVGRLWAQRTDRVRPAPGGVSVGHYAITAGTLGTIVTKSGDYFILSNNHVLAASNSGSIGEDILQPGKADKGSQPADVIGTLAGYVPIIFGDDTPFPPDCPTAEKYADFGNKLAKLFGRRHRVVAYLPGTQQVNEIDAAIALVGPNDVSTDILEIGTLTGVVEAELGMPVRKSGRTTGLTTDTVIGVDATVTVGYGAGQSATFENQIITGPMSQGGDSGSVLVHGDELLGVGLLFAGSNQVTIHGRLQTALDLLGVELA